jgi:response regulator of citrate/malate metabolism
VIDYLNKPLKFEDLQAALYRRVLCSGQGESADS